MKYLIVSLGIVLSMSCNSIKMSHSPHKLSKMDKQFMALDTTLGAHDLLIDFIDIQPWTVRVVFPEKGSSKPKSLIIALHWAGGGDTYKVFSECLVEPAFAKRNAILLTPDAENEAWYSPKNKKRLIKLIKLAQKNWSVSPANTVIMGYSNGGNGAWYYAEHYSELFCAAIPMASAYEPSGNKIGIPMYVIHGANDELFDINQTRVWVKSAQEVNDKVIFRRVPSLSHYEACQYLPVLKDAVEWLDKG